MDECGSGYPKLAACIDSDETFMIYRRFGYLRSRLLLYYQDRLAGFERTLDSLDKKDAHEHARRLCSRQADCNQARPQRPELFLQLARDMKLYGMLDDNFLDAKRAKFCQTNCFSGRRPSCDCTGRVGQTY